MLTIGAVLPSVIRDLQEPQKLLRQQLVEKWSDIVGARFSGHTKPSLNARGELWVLADQSVLAYELHQKYSQSILKRAQSALGETAVKAVRFRVGELR